MHIIALVMGLFMTLVGIAGVVFWVWTLIDCVTNKRLTETQKVIWVLVIFFVGFVGALIYFFAGRSPKAYVPVRPYYYQPQVSPQPRPAEMVAEHYPAYGEHYNSYREGYRAQESGQAYQPGVQTSSHEEQPMSSQVQNEHIQISYPE